MTATERAATLRDLCMDAMQARMDAQPPGDPARILRGAHWLIGMELMPDVVAMRRPDGLLYEYEPGFDGTPGRLFGLPVTWVEGLDGLSIVTGDAL
jgi:hypothetical protein